ncbi:MAG TPA: PASTA domain-containing protein [Candidatus Binatia bacterium]|nr:PASTA domain-containing protein [Candidatus Binatia bacterium]
MPHDSVPWALRVALRISVLLAVGFLSMMAAIRFTIHGREVIVPDLSRLHAGDAQARLAERGLTIKIEDRAYSELPRDAVIRQSPKAGESVRKTQRVHVVVSLGPQALPVPDLVGRSQRSARIALLEAGMQLGHVSSAYLAGVEADTVAQQDPPGNVRSTHSARLDLLVSLGDPPEAYVMPDLVGLSPVQAQERLVATGLALGKFQMVLGPPERRGSVVGQSVPRGSRVLAGTMVDIQLGT